MTPAPQPLPPAERTVGQLVGETIRLYGRSFWQAIAIGVAPAASSIAFAELSGSAAFAIAVASALAWAVAYVAACLVALKPPRGREHLAAALAVAVIAFVPFAAGRAVEIPGFDLVALVAFAFFGLSVPVALVEGCGVVASLRRAVELARADFVHVLGGLATLLLVMIVVGLFLAFFLQSLGDAGLRTGAFLSFLVLSPLFLLGAALLYVDQAARVVDSGRPTRKRPRRASRADLHPADDAHGAGRPDAQVEP